METFKVIAIVPVSHLSHFLKQFEKLQIPYNVELSKEKIGVTPKNGSGQELILELLKSGPMKGVEIGKAFEAKGFSRKSFHSPIHYLKKNKMVKHTKQGYSLVSK